MSYRRAIIALVLTVIWITAAWHVGLEANGWMPAHDHASPHVHSDADHDHASGDSPAHSHALPGDDAHEPVVARGGPPDGRLLLWQLGLCLASVGLIFWCVSRLCGSRVVAPPRPRWREHHLLARWRFVRRCASFTTAPPRAV